MSPLNVLTRTLMLVIALLPLWQTVSADEIERLVINDRLRVNTWLSPEDNIQARQQVTLNIRIDTDTRFAGGTRIGRFDMANAIVLQRNQFAVNSAFNEGGQSWTSQLWQLEIFPLDQGDYIIPPIELDVTISTGVLDSVTGSVYTNPVSFTAIKPELLEQIDIWVASERFDVEESYDQSPETFAPGDALVRRIIMTVQDIPAMMLPEVVTSDFDGVSVYQKPAQVEDSSNRGDSTGTRTETITYIFEEPGEYYLPELKFYWWNTNTGALEVLTLPERLLVVEGGMPVDESAGQEAVSDTPLDMKQLATLAILVLGAAIAIWLGTKLLWLVRRIKRWQQAQALKPPSEDKLRKQFYKACQKGNARLALSLLYQWADHYAGEPYQSALRPVFKQLGEEQTLALFNQLTASGFGASDGDQAPDLNTFADKVVAIAKTRQGSRFKIFEPVELKLN